MFTESEAEEMRARMQREIDGGAYGAPRLAVTSSTSQLKIPKPDMNGVETQFAQHLDLQMKIGAIKNWWFEAVKLRIGRVGKRCWWSPDFLVQKPDGSMILYDTKSQWKSSGNRPHAEDDAIVKARAVAEKYPFPVYFVWKDRKTGEWNSRNM